MVTRSPLPLLDGCINRECARYVIFTTSRNKHLKFTTAQIAKAKPVLGEKFIYEADVAAAVDKAYDLIEGDGLVCIIGTQSLVRDIKECFKQDTLKL